MALPRRPNRGYVEEMDDLSVNQDEEVPFLEKIDNSAEFLFESVNTLLTHEDTRTPQEILALSKQAELASKDLQNKLDMLNNFLSKQPRN